MVVSQNWQISGMDWCESGWWRCLLKVVDVIDFEGDVGEIFYDLSCRVSNSCQFDDSLTTAFSQFGDRFKLLSHGLDHWRLSHNSEPSFFRSLNTIQHYSELSKNQIHKKITRKCKLGSKNRFASSFSRFADSLDFCSSVVKSAGSAHCPTSLFPPPAIIDAAQVQISERGWLSVTQSGVKWVLVDLRCAAQTRRVGWSRINSLCKHLGWRTIHLTTTPIHHPTPSPPCL